MKTCNSEDFRSASKNFEIKLTDWNIVEDVGLPKVDLGWYVFITDFRANGDYFWGIGGFNLIENIFYCKLSMGGMVTDASSVVAWKAWSNIYDDKGAQLIYKGCEDMIKIIDEQKK